MIFNALSVIFMGMLGFLSTDTDSSDKISSLRELQNLSLLEDLNLEGTSVRDKAVYPLAFLRELKFLNLKSDNLSDIDLHALSSPLPSLQVLGFRGAVLTNSGLLLYSPPPRLRRLDLRGCWLLTADVISLFCKHHPQIQVRHEHVNSADMNSAGASSFSKPAKAPRARPRGTKSLQVPNFVGEILPRF